MNFRTLFNAYAGDVKTIRVMEYAGDYNAIGADLEEDYKEICRGKYTEIPEEIKERNVEYFTIYDGDFYVYLEE